MAPQSTLAEYRSPSRGSTATRGCTKRLAPGCVWRCDCNTSLDQHREPACFPRPSALPVPTTCAVVTCTSPVQQLRAKAPAKANLQMLCTHLHWAAGLQWLQQKQTSREKNETAHCQEGDGESWKTEGESRTGKQLAAFFILLFFFKWKTFFASSSNVRGAVELLKGKTEA